MIPTFFDYETFWSADHSLSKMSAMNYVMHPRTQIISMGVKVGDAPTDVFFGEEEIRHAMSKLDWSKTWAIAHNMSEFDAMLMAWRLGARPRLWGCTLAMARPAHAKTTGLGLGKLAEHYGIGTKNSAALINTRGKRLEDFTPDEVQAMRTYNRDDVDLCAALFHNLVHQVSHAELFHIDCNIRMLVEPRFVVDRPLLEAALSVERSAKFKALVDLAALLRADGDSADEAFWDRGEGAMAEWVREQMASAPKFAALLERRGVEVPMKPSPTNPDNEVPALAKTDEAFQALAEHDDPVVAAAARTRLQIKSTLLETRIDRILEVSGCVGGRLPVPLRYVGADTTGRDSGWEYNCQNLPRVDPSVPRTSDALRRSLRAPKGYVVGVADQSGIELRVNHFLWKVPSSMALYRASPDKADLYRAFAATYYGKPPEEIDGTERRFGKVCQLGLGFGSGAGTFQRVARTMGGIELSEAQAGSAVSSWRTTYPEIVEGWRTCGTALADVTQGVSRSVDPWGLVATCSEGLRLPSGRLIRYPNLRLVDEGQTWPDGRSKKSWVYAEGRNKTYLTGPKVDENCLAAGTLVLTDKGWKDIVNVLDSDLVHDGRNFVPHGGVVARGAQACVEVDGVRMTPDHEVFTDDGWKAAAESPRPHRPEIGHVHGAKPGHVSPGEEGHLGLPVRLRPDRPAHVARDGQGECPRWNAQLWLRDEAPDLGEESQARHDAAPGVRGVEVDAGPLPPPHSSVVEKLRRARDLCLRSVGAFRGLLARYGADLRLRARSGQDRQRRPVLPGELPVDYAESQHHEPALQPPRRGHPSPGEGPRDLPVNAVLPRPTRVAASCPSPAPGRPEQVFDILNCGPERRFVVLGDGGPFLVHNCVQALARDSVFEAALRFYKLTGLRPVLRVHDELVYIFPQSEADDLLARLQAVMRTPPSWWPELVVWSEGSVAETYGDAK